ncbi:hypothetical protein WN51_07211, partial [Melipona quadrifasciata]
FIRFQSSSHYCIWGLCDPQQYCCGDNVCCNEADFNSLLLTVIISGTGLLLLILCCICYYCISRQIYVSFIKKYFKINYVLMSNQCENKTNILKNQESVEDCIVSIEKTKTML